MATCPTCTTPLPADALFCPRCGASTPTGISQETGRTTFSAPTVSTAEALSARRAEVQRALGAAFEVRQLIGQGGFGEVWAATDVRLKRDVAVKVLREELVASPALLERFRREAEAAAKLRHPNVVPIYQVGEAEGLVFFVMPLIKGESLRARLEREGRLDVAEAVRILLEAAGALHEAHAAGIVHRDIKPDNILLEGDQRRVLLMDFGIAKSLQAGEGGLTGTGMVIGTPQYMSPEQATGEKHIDARSDLYSLGVVAYQMLCGRLPYEADGAQGMIVAHITATPEPIEKARKGVPEELAAAVMRALAKRPEARWPTAAEFAAAIRPPVPVSEESPLRWVAKRLRRSVRGARRRLVWYGAVLVVILAGSVLADRHVFATAWRYWRSLGTRERLTQARLAVQRASAQGPLFREHGWGTAELAKLGDSLVIVFAGNSAPATFDGTTWQVVSVPGRAVPGPVVADGVWVFAANDRETVAYALTRSGPEARDTIVGVAVRAWISGSDVLLALADGGMLRGRPGAWRREPTGTRTPLLVLAGDRRRQIGLGVFARGGADSLLVFNGLNWRTVDARPDTSRLWVYDAVGALPDGTLLVAGQDCRVAYRDCRGLLARLPPGRDRWVSVNEELPAFVEFMGLAVQGPDVVWLHGRGPGCPTPACLYRDSAGRVELAPDLGRSPVLGMALLRGAPVVVTASGAVWTRREGAWGVLGELPTSIYRGGNMLITGAIFRRGWGDGTVLLAGEPGVRRMLYQDSMGGRSRRWAVTSAGTVVMGECDRMGTRLTCAPVDPLPVPGAGAVSDIALLEGTVIAAAAGGRVFRWRGGWQPMSVAGAPMDSVVELATGNGRVAVALTGVSVWSWDSSASVWRSAHRVPDWVGTAQNVAVHPLGGAVVVAGDRGVALLPPTGLPQEIRGARGAPADVVVLEDGRAVLSYPTREDPLLGGELVVTSRIDRQPVVTASVSTGQADVYGLEVRGGSLHGTGSGWLVDWASLERLPFQDSASLRSRGPQRSRMPGVGQ